MSVLYDYHITGDTVNVALYGTTWRCMVFTASATYNLSSVKIKTFRTGSPGTVTISIRAVASDKPTGSDLCSGTIDGNSFLSSSPGDWQEVTMSSTYKVTSGTQYAIVVRAPSGDVSNSISWRWQENGNGYSNGGPGSSTDSGSSWTKWSDWNDDYLFEVYGGTVPIDKIHSKKLIAVANQEVWYESSVGTMSELSDANGDIDVTVPLAIFEAYQKVFIVNRTNFKIADFANTKLSTADIRPDDVNNVAPIKGTILTGGTSTATMVVDFCNAFNGAALVYGYVTSGTFQSGEVVTGTNVDGTPTAVSFTTDAAPVSNPHWYDWTVYPTIGGVSFGSMPNKAYLGCLYRGRCVISGDPEHPFQWYMARQGHPWDFAYIANDAQTPVKGGNSDAGELGDIIKTLIPYKDDFLVFGCASSIWYLAGDPSYGGTINELDLTTGMFGADSWCFDGEGYLYFWGTNGIYVTSIPGTPKCITETQLPNLVDDESVDPSTHRITLAYDRKRTGILICITKLSDGTNSNWWYDLRSGGLFPESYNAVNGAYSLFHYPADDNDYRDLLVGCKDGYIRKFNASLKSDNTTADATGAGTLAINSYITFGPVPLSQDPDKLGKLTAPNLITAGGGSGGSQSDSDNVAYKIFTANSAEKLIEKLAANTSPQVGGTFIAPGRQTRNRRLQKIKGAYLGVRLENTTVDESWGFEKFIGTVVPSGRIK